MDTAFSSTSAWGSQFSSLSIVKIYDFFRDRFPIYIFFSTTACWNSREFFRDRLFKFRNFFAIVCPKIRAFMPHAVCQHSWFFTRLFDDVCKLILRSFAGIRDFFCENLPKFAIVFRNHVHTFAVEIRNFFLLPYNEIRDFILINFCLDWENSQFFSRPVDKTTMFFGNPSGDSWFYSATDWRFFPFDNKNLNFFPWRQTEVHDFRDHLLKFMRFISLIVCRNSRFFSVIICRYSRSFSKFAFFFRDRYRKLSLLF